MTDRIPTYPDAPKGKRTVKTNVYGNVVGYVAGRRFWEFGTGRWDEKTAERWATGLSLEEANYGDRK